MQIVIWSFKIKMLQYLIAIKGRGITIPSGVIPVAGVSPWPSTQAQPADLHIRVSQLHLVLFLQSCNILWGNGSRGKSTPVTEDAKPRTAELQSHGKPQSLQI